jgi:hypothetical protein
MTDIARHLNIIVQTLHGFIEGLAHSLTTDDLAKVREQLARRPPDSYGIGSGVVIDDYGNTSQPIQFLIYDRPLAANTYTSVDSCFHIQHVLLIVDVTTQRQIMLSREFT